MKWYEMFVIVTALVKWCVSNIHHIIFFQIPSVAAILAFQWAGGWPRLLKLSPPAPPFSQICLLSVSRVKFRFKTALSRRYRLVSEALSQIAVFLVDFVLGCSWLPLPFCLPRSFANCKTSVFLDCIWGNKAKKGNRGGVQECNL